MRIRMACKTTAKTNSAAPTKRMPAFPMVRAVKSVNNGPTRAPAVPPAAITGKSRFACPESKSSTRKLQKTETRKRLRTLMKT
jgi:hypothetical protein